ncbi:hypothetical protein [Nocardia sp. BMG51109]|uniref:hypothetical protein n=1 Tax=Nocardia sp. BMG51109 TaxID=1056816 RepID=UPI000465E61B|nr:hypothetical protein [Nocardia sp. BMG51109]
MNTERDVVVPVLVPDFSGLVPRAVVAFSVLVAFAVLAMIAIVTLFPGENYHTSPTTRVSTTQVPEQAPACYPFGNCTPTSGATVPD